MSNTSAPRWQCAFKRTKGSLEEEMQIRVYDFDLIDLNDFLGEVRRIGAIEARACTASGLVPRYISIMRITSLSTLWRSTKSTRFT